MPTASSAWRPDADVLLERVLAEIPPFVRGMVRRVVRSESERRAAEGQVTALHVREAFAARTPAPMRPLLARALGEASVESPEFPVGAAMTPDEIDRYLAWEMTGRLAVVDADGRPYVVPLSFVHDRGVVCYHWFSEGGRKEMAVARSRRACFEADWASRDHLRYRSVIADGEVSEVQDPAEKARVLDRLEAKYPAYATGSGHSRAVRGVFDEGREAMVEAVRVYRIAFLRVTGKKKGPGPEPDA